MASTTSVLIGAVKTAGSVSDPEAAPSAPRTLTVGRTAAILSGSSDDSRLEVIDHTDTIDISNFNLQMFPRGFDSIT